MTVPLTFRGRLPGVLVETALPERREAPLHLDVAGFVGFAERGPVNTPVALEDYSGFTRVFGGDLPVAVDNGAPVFAHLPGAVRAFFDNGGRRCYVVRVVGISARANRLPLPGLAAVDTTGDFRQAIASAAWVGRWSDSMSVGTQLRTLPLRICPGYLFNASEKTVRLNLALPTPTTVREGDMLRLSYADLLGTQMYLRVARVWMTGHFSVDGFGARLLLESVSDNAAFSSNAKPPADAPTQLEQLHENGWASLPGSLYPIITETADATQPNAEYALFLPADTPVQVGDLLRVRYLSGEVFYFPVLSVRTHYAPPFADDPMLPEGDPVLPEGVYRRVITDQLIGQQVIGPAGGELIEVERLRFDLTIIEGERTLERVQDLSFNPTTAYLAARESEIPLDNPITDYWVDRLSTVQDNMRAVEPAAFSGRSLHLRGPEAVPQVDPVWLPLAMRSLPTFAAPLADNAVPGKDGLDAFDPEQLFLDPQLASSTVEGLMTSAEYILYIQQPAGTLIKLHSLTGIEEIGLIAVPDLAHRAWFPPPAPPAPPPVVPPPKPEQDWANFAECLRPDDIPVPPYNPEDAPCRDSPIELLTGVELAVDRDPCLQLAGLAALQPSAAYDSEPLLAVQRALITVCAARADALAILSVPAHFKQRELADWQTRLVNTPALLSSPALSYAAAYHGWTLTREETCPALAPVRALPPDGALCGSIAARERLRGAWIAPANEALAGVIGLTPALTDSEWEDLYNRQINIVRAQPGRFTLMSAFTLSADRLLVQISVRRLLIFLRKLALRRGQRFVFETNNERFRQQVQVSFERLLAALVERGALVAFQVVTNEEINTPNDEFNGRFLVALKVAPTLPIEFITVVMLRSGESLLEVLER
jgi:hypothetical protein